MNLLLILCITLLLLFVVGEDFKDATDAAADGDDTLFPLIDDGDN